MLTLLAIALITTLMTLVMSSRVSVLVALILVPVAFGVLGGFGAELAPMAIQGLQKLAPTLVMLCFALLYFSIMSDAGLFAPLIRGMVRLVEGDPLRIALGTAILGLIVSLDGDGATTYLICVAALLPLYRRIGMNPAILSGLLMLACGITNIAPWGGPTARVAAALKVDPAAIFVPLLPALFAGAAFIVILAFGFGHRERRRLAAIQLLGTNPLEERLAESSEQTPLEASRQASLEASLARPRLVPVNLALTLALFVALIFDWAPLVLLFLIAAPLALLINYPSLEAQQERLRAHAPNILNIVAVGFGVGVFVGILDGTGMLGALAQDTARVLPTAWAHALAPATAVLSMPFSFFMGNTTFFFSVVPVLAETGAQYGTPAVEFGRAAVLDGAVHLLSPLVPSTHLLVGLTGISFGQHQRTTLPWAILMSLIMIATALLTGALSFGA